MSQLTLALITGLAIGGTYVLISLGLVLGFRATETMNFSHGQLMVLPAMIVGSLLAEGTSFWVALALAVVLNVGIALVFYRVVLRRMTGANLFMPVIATFGLAALLDGVLNWNFSGDQYTVAVPGLPSGTVTILGARVSLAVIVTGAFAYALALVVLAALRYTHLGVAMRASGQDPLLASQGGIHVYRIHMLAWAGVGVLAAVAGVVYGSTHSVNPSLTYLGLIAFPALLLGGIDSFGGAVLGGIAIGTIEGLTATYIDTSVTTVVSYSLLLLVLLVIPNGLFGTRDVRRV